MVNYGFVIDNRKCIGCHACTIACKSEHDIPIGVNRTHVKYIEKGEYPDVTREFSVHRCNHCEDAPCTTICPTTALFTREDGIVDFDDERCIGCKSCMQACPYDALYIDPNKGTAAKCNYCAHRIEESYEPSCVIVCPTEAIISGDLDDPNSSISGYVRDHVTTVRKPESGAKPNVFYIEASEEMLDPHATERDGAYLWTDQAAGVGHFAKYAEERAGAADTNSMIVQLALEKKARAAAPRDKAIIRDVMAKLDDEAGRAKRSYDQPSKGILWGWEVSAYIWTKAIASGTYIVAMLAMLSGQVEMTDELWWSTLGIGLGFLTVTGILLVVDLDRPERFLYVLLRPNWDSWLVKGAYVLAGFGAVLAASAAVLYMGLDRSLLTYLAYAGIPLAALTGVYTAWLFQQAKGRSWSEDGMLPLKFLIETMVVGAAVFIPMVLREPIAVVAGLVLLAAAWLHGKRVVMEPQMETLH
ncbi:MAG: 4Fe-4S ferredoxin [Candidatus Thalassarchaeum betae]|uniref:4Fe-4S ferredoxin n=1 Tax=Candidatus Thalassarchaeum betae TaxID=2599289 RepID=A0A2V3HPX2_9ARCH|nr:MAG: 4Fe-4S ferredoxin [Candidatus Thalassoarchaea betae]HIC50895.1 4Fe-4S ferredoxin [Candidatus Poseidoniales archaeon]HIM93169.1 4Fe-4S ferredoxin [Candidatus Poseidoniales archaeon]